jgi:hypothetical protein
MVLGVLTLSLAAHTLAQRTFTLVPGQRLRVTAPAQGAYDHEVRYVATSGDTLVLTAGIAVMYPLADVVRLEILRGYRSHKWPGAVIGLVLGTAIGWRIGKAIDGSCTGWCYDYGQYAGPVVGALVGVGAGAVIGSSIRTGRWEKVPLDRLRVSVVPARNGFGLGASIAF